MKVVCWNIQGIKKRQAISELKFLIKKHLPDLVFILETMVNTTNIQKILPQLGFDHYDFVPPLNHSGGIAVLWNNGTIHASILLKEQRAIHMLVHDTENSKNSIISGVYAPTQTKDKNAFWERLTRMNTIIDVPWCLMGDFNELASANDKLGGVSPHANCYSRLNQFLTTVNAEVLLVSGNRFTWKKRIHTHLVYERLDRTLARNDWANIYPNAIELHEIFTCSDHCPIVMTTSMNHRSTKAFPFRFQNFWCKF